MLHAANCVVQHDYFSVEHVKHGQQFLQHSFNLATSPRRHVVVDQARLIRQVSSTVPKL
jgi:hypothetical protein